MHTVQWSVILKHGYFDGNLYGLPTYRDLASQAGFMCRADILEELGYKAEDIKNFDDIEEVLKNARKYIRNFIR